MKPRIMFWQFEPWPGLSCLPPSHFSRFMSQLHPGHPYYRFTCQTLRRGKGWIRILNCVISIRLGLEVAWWTRQGGRGERERQRGRAWERFTTIHFGALLAADLSGEQTTFNSPISQVNYIVWKTCNKYVYPKLCEKIVYIIIIM